MKLRITILKYHSCYLYQISLLLMLLPRQIKRSYKEQFVIIVFCKITKIVRAFWLAERSVCMRVCKHGCDFKMVCFSRANHASTNLKNFFSSSKFDKFTLFTHSFVGLRKCVNFFFRLSWHFKQENSVFWKASFCKTRTDYACKTSWTRLCDWLESVPYKEFWVFSRESYFIKAIENFFPVFA